ncbi:BamA/TamA family outer membrane protein [Dokdonia sp. Hel_I_53]|uniref:translocation and assembly module lipoprotein TamL n=1 Tax=Dokdonia sp. Hel_I_53 TaxID=1566287 RepID=UPI00119AC232|nr:BamA/TamA family outer membrane protein [Dokdonia sp. Hel_I_53]TVZ51423.1 outer membrane protein assembly factor BamA [Dokdonia sp. Hel_I_53]
MQLKKTSYYLILILIIGISTSCSVEKFIPEGERLYTGGEVVIESDTTIINVSQLNDELESVLRPSPNSKILGMYPGLYVHYKSQREKPGFINRFLNKKIGEEPVYQSDVAEYEVEDLLRNRLENRGFFYSVASSRFRESENSPTASITYTVQIPEPYRMQTYQLDTLSPPIYREMISSIKKTQFEKGMRYDLSNLKLERDRIDYNLKRKGYYNFNPSFLIFEVDTNQYKNKRFDLYLKVKKGVPKKVIVPYKIKEINVYPDYDLSDTLVSRQIRYDSLNFIQDEVYFKPKYLARYITLKEGALYNPDTSRNTARRLSTIGAYKFVNIQYEEIDSLRNDSLGILKANIYLSPLNKRAVRAELQAVTKSNNFAGPGLALTYTNRNLFKGGEILNITGAAGYEVQLGGGESLSSIELGLSGELIFPRLLFPVKINEDFFKYNIPKTVTALGVDYLNRSKLYTLLSGNAGFGYSWDSNKFVTHRFNPISISYTRLSNTTSEFETILRENTFLKRSFQKQFIAGSTYNFTYNGMVNSNSTHQFFLNAGFEIAGNTVSLFGKDVESSEDDIITDAGQTNGKAFLGLEYAQFAKLDVDARYHFNFGRNKDQKIATRLFAGYGYAYGNSDILPFVKQYYAGGPYSVRAFRIRSLGPGTSDGGDTQNTFFDQIGNLRLEANAEYRFPIFGFVKGAFFVDAGNIWNSEDNPELDGDEFTSSFMSELGIGGGFGLRVDVQGFVIRFDLAAPFHDPSLEEGERWDFKIDEPLLNFAIGYPF